MHRAVIVKNSFMNFIRLNPLGTRGNIHFIGLKVVVCILIQAVETLS